jgi:hypothetical protein
MSIGQSRLAETITQIELRTNLDLSRFVTLGSIKSCVRVAAINDIAFSDTRCHRGLAAKYHQTIYRLADGSLVQPGHFVVGENVYSTFTQEGQMGVVFHEILHLTYSQLKELQVDYLVRYYGVHDELRSRQHSLAYSKGVSTLAQRKAVARSVGLIT